MCGCGQLSQSEYERLAYYDRIMAEKPGIVLDSLLSINTAFLGKQDVAYYQLLLTIAKHKNHLPFVNDSSIAIAHEYYKHSNDHYNLVRSSFYHGLVLFKLSSNNVDALTYMQEAAELIQQYAINDVKLEALLYAFLGKIHKVDNNEEEAIGYYIKAFDAEQRADNPRNVILDYCDLLICLTKKDDPQARYTLQSLDSAISRNPHLHLENVSNAKAIYYLHHKRDLDSAFHYCMMWNPTSPDRSAKCNMLSTICRERGDIQNAITYEQAAYSMRRAADTLSYHVYFRNLADLYGELGNADSTVHYARLAYQSLHDSFETKTEKRILELEKQYDLSAKQAELDKARSERRLLWLSLSFTLIAAGLLTAILLLTRRNLALANQERTKDAIAQSLVKAVVATYAGINNKLSVIHNLPEEQRQAA